MTIAFVFPGQGSQSVGMLGELAQAFPQVRSTFAEASAALGYDLWQLTQDGPESRLNETECTQPAMLTAGVAVWRTWQAQGGPSPSCMAGHSLGEYTALVCAGALDFADAVTLVRDRGRFMQEAVPQGEGAIAAVLGLDDDAVSTVCEQAAQGAVVSAVNFNAPGQVVVAGHRDAVERALVLAKQAGAKRAVQLPLSIPPHCELMRPAAQRLSERLAQVKLVTPSVPVLHNVDAAEHSQPAELRAALNRHLFSPVRWSETVREMARSGVTTIIECGPGKVLAGLTRRIDRNLAAIAIHDPATLEGGLTQAG